ncbi:S8 family serine peptidase [Spongiivirga citrea]|uniref:S8 family serine peptidase n=1 Tax=Spongiivirga citrea TaxID=1481457 RepID=A0A6M0CHI2_9FLAO|nr:S8 family serine peptidase [Spongiivirga citrea]NER17321.1 S8 family serine peptidase [Spongiivirga citrea]
MKYFFSFVCLFCAIWSSIGQQLSSCKKWDYLADIESASKDKKEPSNYYLIHLHNDEKGADHEVIRRLDKNHHIVFSEIMHSEFTPVNNNWKLSNNFSFNNNSKRIFIIKSKANTRTIANTLRAYNADIIKQQNGRLVVKTNIEVINKAVLNNPDVIYVGNEAIYPKQESVVNDFNTTINGINTLKNAFPELKGSTKTIGVKDNQSRQEDIDLIGKNVDSPIISEIVDDHATDMSTIISGLGNSSATSLGVSSEATIFLSDFNEVFPDSQMILDNAQVRIQNHSYGTEIENFYGELAFEYDNLVAQNPQMLHVFSSGNSGLETSENGAYSGIAGFANITGNFKMSKNTLLVGAMDELNQVTDFSSKGPAYDGRIKPELVGYSFEGTSNTAAMVSGAANLVQEAYENETGSLPAASLIKAVLINAADDIGPQGPDFSSGYGSLNAKKAVDIVKEGSYINDVISSNQTKTFIIDIPESATNLKITLAWTDPAANVNDNMALINDLDLKLTSPTSQETLPWVLNIEANASAIQNPATRGVDALNNIEQIGLETITPGNYTISVIGNTLVSDQAFSLAYSWEETDQFSWTYPLENENYPYNGEFVYALRWAQSFSENTIGILSVQYNNEGVWQPINAEVNIDAGFYQWNPPEDFTGTAQLRMTVGNVDYLSSPFTITKAFNLRVPLNCEGVVELSWPKNDAISNYRIYNLQGRQLEEVAQVADTLFTFQKTAYESPFFAVSPILNETTDGIRSPTINHQNFTENCYFTIAFAELTEDKSAVLLTSELGSLSNIESISVYRILAGGQEQLIETLTDLSSAFITVQDDDPSLGQNNYQFRINTVAGSIINSDILSAFYFTDKEPYLLFPNPIIDKGFNVYSSKEDEEVVILELYDLKGRLLLRQEITSDRDFVDIQSLQSGIYLYNIESSKKNYKSGKLLVNTQAR